MDLIVTLIVSNLTPWLMERLKSVSIFPMAAFAPIANRVVPLLVALLVASGVTYEFHDGTLTIAHLVPSDMLRGVLLWIVGAVTQQIHYRMVIDPKASQ